MRFVSFFIAIGCVGLAFAQEPTAVDFPLPSVLPAQAPLEPLCPIGCGHRIGADLLIGLPTAVRLQAGLIQRENSTVAIDGLFGAIASQRDASTVIGVGPRLIWNMFSDNCANAFQINPGCYFLGALGSSRHSGGSLVVAPTADFVWIHDVQKRAAFQGGLEIGTGYGTRGEWFPLVAIFAGLRF